MTSTTMSVQGGGGVTTDGELTADSVTAGHRKGHRLVILLQSCSQSPTLFILAELDYKPLFLPPFVSPTTPGDKNRSTL